MQIAPTYAANIILLISIILTAFHIEVAPEALQTTVTTILVIGVPLFTLARQVWTGRSTLMGTRPTTV